MPIVNGTCTECGQPPKYPEDLFCTACSVAKLEARSDTAERIYAWLKTKVDPRMLYIDSREIDLRKHEWLGEIRSILA